RGTRRVRARLSRGGRGRWRCPHRQYFILTQNQGGRILGGSQEILLLGMKQKAGIFLVIQIVLFSAGVQAAEPQPEKPALSQARKKQLSRKTTGKNPWK